MPPSVDPHPAAVMVTPLFAVRYTVESTAVLRATSSAVGGKQPTRLIAWLVDSRRLGTTSIVIRGVIATTDAEPSVIRAAGHARVTVPIQVPVIRGTPVARDSGTASATLTFHVRVLSLVASLPAFRRISSSLPVARPC